MLFYFRNNLTVYDFNSRNVKWWKFNNITKNCLRYWITLENLPSIIFSIEPVSLLMNLVHINNLISLLCRKGVRQDLNFLFFPFLPRDAFTYTEEISCCCTRWHQALSYSREITNKRHFWRLRKILKVSQPWFRNYCKGTKLKSFRRIFFVTFIMELYLYKGEFNIPSIDFDCLRVVVSDI